MPDPQWSPDEKIAGGVINYQESQHPSADGLWLQPKTGNHPCAAPPGPMNALKI